MTIDTTFFGYGAGLVLIGWVCGMVARFVFSALGLSRSI